MPLSDGGKGVAEHNIKITSTTSNNTEEYKYINDHMIIIVLT